MTCQSQRSRGIGWMLCGMLALLSALCIVQAAGADYLITGNKKHFPLVTFQKTKIVSPREFLESEGAHIA